MVATLPSHRGIYGLAGKNRRLSKFWSFSLVPLLLTANDVVVLSCVELLVTSVLDSVVEVDSACRR